MVPHLVLSALASLVSKQGGVYDDCIILLQLRVHTVLPHTAIAGPSVSKRVEAVVRTCYATGPHGEAGFDGFDFVRDGWIRSTGL